MLIRVASGRNIALRSKSNQRPTMPRSPHSCFVKRLALSANTSVSSSYSSRTSFSCHCPCSRSLLAFFRVVIQCVILRITGISIKPSRSRLYSKLHIRILDSGLRFFESQGLQVRKRYVILTPFLERYFR